jgi:hypothetical protein
MIVMHHIRIQKGHTPQDRYNYNAFLPLSSLMNNNQPPRNDDEGQGFANLLRRIDEDVQLFHGRVPFVLSDRGEQRVGQSLLGATARGRPFWFIEICPYYMTANAFQYSALLEFLTIGQYAHAELYLDAEWPAPPPGMLAAMEHMVTAMIANPQPAAAILVITEMTLTMSLLNLALQRPRVVLKHCQMESSPLQQQPARVLLLPIDAADRDDSPEQGTTLQLTSCNDWSGILQALVKTNVTSLHLDFYHPIVGPLDISSVIGFVAAQPNSMHLALTFFRPTRIDADVLMEHILANVLTKCGPLGGGVHSLFIRLGPNDAVSPLRPAQFPRLMALVSGSVLTQLQFLPTFFLSQEQQQQLDVILQRNRTIPVYLKTVQLLQPRQEVTHNRPPIHVQYDNDEPGHLAVDPSDPPIIVYDNDEDRRMHQFVLSHALSQAAVHPVFFSHFYQYVRDHVDPLFGQESRRRRPAPAAAAAAPPPP